MSSWRLSLYAVDEDGVETLVHRGERGSFAEACREQVEFVGDGGLPTRWWRIEITEEREWT